jgi:hypothetical protein
MERKQTLSLVMIAIRRAVERRAEGGDPLDRDPSSSEDVAMTGTQP